MEDAVPGSSDASAATQPDLTARRIAGERFFLALVDPLLSKPAFFELRRPKTTVGFLPDCDWTLPWGAMGIDVISDSRRFDETYQSNRCASISFDGSLCAPQIGHRQNEPFFEVSFDTSSGAWRVSCPEGHGCRVGTLRSRHLLRCRRDRPEREVRVSSASSVDLTEDGSTFLFSWPWASVDGGTRQVDLPAQKLRFVFISCLEGQQPAVHQIRDGPPTLLSLPIEVLAHIGSYLNPHEYFSTVALVGRVFTSPRLKKQIPWTSVTLDASFDSFRTVAMASTETLRAVKCREIWNSETKAAFHAKWRPAIFHESLTTLDLEDTSLLLQVGVPPGLKELRLRMKSFRPDFWHNLKLLTFPSSVSCFRVHYGFDMARIHEDPWWTDHLLDATHAGVNIGNIDTIRLDPVWLFKAFPGLNDVEFEKVAFVDAEWENVLPESLRHVERLSVTPSVGKIPVQEFTNLTALNLAWDERTRDVTNEADVFVRHVRRHGGFGRLRYLQMKTPKRFPVRMDKLHRAFPRLEFLFVNNVRAPLDGMCTLIEQLPSLKEVDVVSCPVVRSVIRDVPRSSFPQYPGMFLRWTWFPANDVGGEAFSFIFSRATNDEREVAGRLLSRVGLVAN